MGIFGSKENKEIECTNSGFKNKHYYFDKSKMTKIPIKFYPNYYPGHVWGYYVDNNDFEIIE
jgi:hypothetical protein